jgi:hypothetical protein
MQKISEKSKEGDLLTQMVSLDRDKLTSFDDAQIQSISLIFRKMNRTPEMIMYMLMREQNIRFDYCIDMYDPSKMSNDAAREVLNAPWEGNCFVVPRIVPRDPNLKIERWLLKCIESSEKNNLTHAILIPSSTTTQWFHNLVLPKAKIMFIEGRLVLPGHSKTSPIGNAIALYSPAIISELENTVLPPSFGPNTGGTKFAVFSSITCDEPELRMMDDEKEEEE